MHFSQPAADIYVPGGSLDSDPAAALARVTHLCIGAHQDDIEIMAHAGICDCLDTPGLAFGGVVVTDGAGSARTGPYATSPDAQMRTLRRDEQRRAADLGRYAIQLQLAHPSSAVKLPSYPHLAADLATIFQNCHPHVIYLHQPADKHDTHVGLLARCLEALRLLPPAARPPRVLGCEVWRDLDWLLDADKIALDSGRHPALARDLLACFDSQIAGGKRYDHATLGRRAAHATYHTSNATDTATGLTYALDLTPLLHTPTLDLAAFTAAHLDRLRADILARLARST